MEFRYKHWCGRAERGRTRAPPYRGATVALKMYSIHAHKGSYSCLEGVTYALGANDRGVTGAWESFVPLTPALIRGRRLFSHEQTFARARAPFDTHSVSVHGESWQRLLKKTSRAPDGEAVAAGSHYIR